MHAQGAPVVDIHNEETGGKVDEREKRWKWFFGSRVGPNGEIPGGTAEWAIMRSRGEALLAAPPAPPGPHGALNWAPLGPSVVAQGQAAGRPAVSGRITALAVGPDGLRVYAGAANGGVWFSPDSGMTWSPLDDYVVSPILTPSVSANALSVGGLAVRFGLGAAVDDIYVGTGEPGAADGYFGIGIRHSTSGGAPGTWSLEALNLAKSNIFRIAIDLDDPGRVFAATGKGLFARPVGGDVSTWDAVASPNFPAEGAASDVILAGRGANRVWYVVFPGAGVFASPDGQQWAAVAGVTAAERVVLAAAPSDPSIVYALASDGSLFRLANGSFQSVDGVPRALFAGNQGGYDLILGVDPADADTVYIGGDLTSDQPTPAEPSDYNLALFKGKVGTQPGGGFLFPFNPENDLDPNPPPDPTNPSYRLDSSWRVPHDPTWIGRGIHPDVHAFAFALTHDSSAFNGESVWVGCDGGLFHSSQSGARGSFEPHNLGLASIEATYLAQHPVSDAIVFCGCQDNGTLRRVGGPVWVETIEGDGGGVALDPVRPHLVIRQYHSAFLLSCTDGGTSGAWDSVNFPPRTVFPPGQTPAEAAEAKLQAQTAAKEDQFTGFYALIVACSLDAQTTRAAFGTYRLWLTEDWGQSWVTLPAGTNPYDPANRPAGQQILAQDLLDGTPISAFAFAGPNRIYAATGGIRSTSTPSGWQPSTVWRFDRGAAKWSSLQIDTSGLPATASITSLAVDDATVGSLYVTLGKGGVDHVWHFDGVNNWRSAGLTAATVDVPAHGVAVDPANRKLIYVGTDVGCWKGIRTSQTTWQWQAFSAGLPEAAITDLAIHAGARLLRVATYGRGLWEIPLDEVATPDPDLFLRVNVADAGRLQAGARPAWLDTIADPAGSGRKLGHAACPDIKIWRASANAPAALIDQPDFLDFAMHVPEETDDGLLLADGHGLNHLYVQVHNRGVSPLPGALVRVLVLLAPVGDGPPPLPQGLANRVAAGDTGGWLAGTAWHFADAIVPYRFLPGVLDARTPQIAGYVVDFSTLGLPAGTQRICAAAFVTTINPTDRFAGVQTDLDQLTMHDKHVAYRIVKLVNQ
jgi:hypothetical protein